MGTKSEEYLLEYKLTNTKTGEIFHARGWKNLMKVACITSNYTTIKKSKKWQIEIISPPEKWDEQSYRKNLSKKYYKKRQSQNLTQHLNGYKKFDYKYDQLLRRKYGIGLYQYHKMIEKQNGKCFICKETTPLVIDHCHNTSKVRSLLCFRCNTTLGKINENVDILQKMIHYIQTPIDEFNIPKDKKIEPKPQEDKKRWRTIIFTPIGVFLSALEAATAYNTSETTIHHWCGDYSYSKNINPDFKSIKEFISLNEARKKYGKF